MLQRVLIANRGDAAVRLVRACHDLGIETVAVYSTADRDGLWVRLLDVPRALEARAYDDAIAFRYIIPEQPNPKDIRLVDERTEFSFPKDRRGSSPTSPWRESERSP